MGNLINIGIYAGVILLALVVLGMIFSRLYRRASKEVSFVRTGFGGQKVIMNGGALVFPVLHEVIPVNMNTLRLEVRRANEQALITRDRMRVDVTAEFYVRVKPLADSIANAAQTLGMCRSDVIRRSLSRDLEYVMSHEVPNMQRFHKETKAAHGSWLLSKRWFGA